jgi:hypothetical protein
VDKTRDQREERQKENDGRQWYASMCLDSSVPVVFTKIKRGGWSFVHEQENKPEKQEDT